MPDSGLEAIGASRGIANAAQLFAAADAAPIETSGAARRLADVDEVDVSRANEYRLLAHLLRQAPSSDLLAEIARIDGDATELGRAHAALAAAAAGAAPETLSREYFDLFIGVGRGKLLPYASYYLTGFLQERPLAKIRDDMAALGIAQDEALSEPEDHIAILCEIMAGMASRQFEVDLATERGFFERHLKPWASRFFGDLEAAASASFYRNVGGLGGLFMDIEAQGFAMLA
jgi:TorA maturation chaperone TorD